jgi:aspartate/glutamate racemase
MNVLLFRNTILYQSQPVGILMLDTKFPRVPGDIGNAKTWPFPVRYYMVEGVIPDKIMGKEPFKETLQQFIDAAKAVESFGVRAITTSCGFLAIFQSHIAKHVSVPFVSSALITVPFVSNIVGNRGVGILTERAENLTEKHFKGVGWSQNDYDVKIYGMDKDAIFPQVFIGNREEANLQELENDIKKLAEKVKEDASVKALVLECTNFVPWGQLIGRITGLPVFHIANAVEMVAGATMRRSYDGAVWKGLQP